MSVKVKDLIEKVRLRIVYGSDDLLEKEISTSDISRPGLEMTGYFDYYTPERIQLIGMKEWSYLMKMTSHNRHQVLLKMFQQKRQLSLWHAIWRFLKKCGEQLKKSKLRFLPVAHQPAVYQGKFLVSLTHAWRSEPVFMAY